MKKKMFEKWWMDQPESKEYNVEKQKALKEAYQQGWLDGQTLLVSKVTHLLLNNNKNDNSLKAFKHNHNQFQLHNSPSILSSPQPQ
jgi:hypothetical protein